MYTIHLRSRVMILVGAGLFSSGCQSEASSDDASTADTTPIASLETQLTDARGGLDEALAQTRTCFDDFRSCRAATPADSTSCQDALRACLPGSVPNRLECAHRGDAGGMPLAPLAPPARFGLWAPWGNSMNAGPFGFEHSAVADAGARSAADCDAAPSIRGPLSQCRDDIDAPGLRQLDPDAIGQEFRACLDDVFGDVIDGVCARIDAECSGANPPRRICDRLADLCKNPEPRP